MTEGQIRTIMTAAKQEAERTITATVTEGNNTVTTTDATPTLALTITPELNTAGTLEVWVRALSGENTLAAYKIVRIKRFTAAGIGTVYDVMAINNDAGLAGATFSITASSPDVLVTVTGIAATEIRWDIEYNLRITTYDI